jgi:copper chaperone CopZ
MSTRTYAVPEISCDHCVNAITGEVTKLTGIDDVAIDIATKTVTVVGDAPDADIVAAIDEAGYAVAT